MSETERSREHDGDEPFASRMSAIGGHGAAFAASVARRVRARGIRRAPLTREWRRKPRVMSTRGAAAGVVFAPVLRITIVTPTGAVRDSSRVRGAASLHVPRVATALMVSGNAPRESLAVSTSHTQKVVTRLLARGTRAEHEGQPANPALARSGDAQRNSGTLSHPRAVPRVLRSATRAPESVAAAEPTRGSAARASIAGAPPTLSVGEVNRLTEHVLRTMDRRISAYRERQGRS